MKTFNKFINENRDEESVCLDEISEMLESYASIFEAMAKSNEHFILENIDKVDESTDDESMSLSEIKDDMKEAFDKFNESLKTGDVESIEEDLTGMARRFKKRVKLVGKEIGKHTSVRSHAAKRLDKALIKHDTAEGGFNKMNSGRHLDSMKRKYDAHMKKSHAEFWHKFKHVR